MKTPDEKTKRSETGRIVSLEELLTPEFLRDRTHFSSLEQVFSASRLGVKNEQDLEGIPVEMWDNYIRTNSRFATWKELLGAATKEWARKKMAG